MKKRIVMTMLLAGCVMALGGTVYAEAEAAEETVAEEAAEEAEEAEEPEAEAPAEDGLSDDIYSFSIKIGENIYQFPMKYTDLVEKEGWAVQKYYQDMTEESLAPNSYTFLGLQKNDNKISVDVINYDINENLITDCYAGGITVDGSFDFDLTAYEVTLPGGIKMGASNLDDIEAAYGTPSDTYSGDLYTKYTYSKDSYQNIDLYVYNDTNTLQKAEVRNFADPEDFVPGEVSTEVPECVTSYVAPTALTDDFTDPIVEFMGDLYRLPAPAVAFINNGWTFENVSEDDYVQGKGFAAVNMSKNNQTVRVYLYNYSRNATAYENCMIRSLRFGSYDSEVIALKLSGGVTLGANVDELMAVAREKDYYVKDDVENGYLTIAKSEDDKYDNNIEFWINTDVDPVAVASIEIEYKDLAE